MFVCLFTCLFVRFLVSVVVVGDEEGCFIGGDNVEGFPWYRAISEGVKCVTHREDGTVFGVACAKGCVSGDVFGCFCGSGK